MTFATCVFLAIVVWILGYLGADLTAYPAEQHPNYIRCPRLLWILLGMPRSKRGLPAGTLHKTSVYLLMLGEISLVLAWFLKNESWVLTGNRLATYMGGAVLVSFILWSMLLKLFAYQEVP